MKKLLATLLVALMIMSCMTVVSFAAAEISSFSDMLGNEFYAWNDDDGFTSDAFWAYASFVESENGLNSNTKKKNYAKGETDPLYTYIYNEDAEADKVTAIDAASASYVFMPFFSSDVLVGINLDITFDKSKLSFVGFASDYMSDYNDKSASSATGLVSAAVSQEPEALIGVAFFKVNADGIGDANGCATETITATITDATDSDGNKLAGTMTMTANLTGLTPGAAEEAPKMEAADVEAMEASKIVYAGEDTFANFKNAYGLGEDVAADYTEEMSYVCAFGTVDTTKEADEYGFKLTTSYGKVITGKAVNVVDGKFGIVFYGADYLIEGATIEAYAIVDGAEI